MILSSIITIIVLQSKIVGSKEEEENKKNTSKIKTFPISDNLEVIKENIIINTNSPQVISKEEKLINKALKLHSQGNIQEAAKYYQYIIEQDYKDPRVFSNYGLILKYQGKLKEAELFTIKAIEIDPNYTHAKINLDLIARQNVPWWHINMINDTERNNYYSKALSTAINENQNVLEIGTGSGLLSMMAIDKGAKTVLSCENNERISKVAKQIISKNGYQKQIKVINKNSKDLILGKDLPQKVDLIISEIFSSEFVGEGIQSTILDAKNRLLKEGGKMIPESGEIKIALLKNNYNIEKQCYAKKINKYDLTDFNRITGNKFDINGNELNLSFLSNENIAFYFDFYSEKIIHKEKIINIKVSESGTCIGILSWIKAYLFGNVYLENNPCKSSESHWSKPLYIFENPLDVNKGDIIQIKASLFEDRVWFELVK